jgi:hypothetical protein
LDGAAAAGRRTARGVFQFGNGFSIHVPGKGTRYAHACRSDPPPLRRAAPPNLPTFRRSHSPTFQSTNMPVYQHTNLPTLPPLTDSEPMCTYAANSPVPHRGPERKEVPPWTSGTRPASRAKRCCPASSTPSPPTSSKSRGAPSTVALDLARRILDCEPFRDGAPPPAGALQAGPLRVVYADAEGTPQLL